MYNVSQETIDAYKEDGVHKIFRVVIENTSYGDDKITDSSLNIKQSILESESFEAIGCIASSLSIELHAQFATKIRGSKIKVFVQIPNTPELQLFDGYIDKCTKTANGWKRSIEAYDFLYNMSGQAGQQNSDLNDQELYNITNWFNQHSSCTIRQLLTDVCTKFNLPIREGNLSLVNGGVTTTCGNVKPVSQMSALDLLKAIMQINGCFGYITSDGYFSWKYLLSNPRSETGMLYPSSFSFPSSTLYPGQSSIDPLNPGTDVNNYIGEYEVLEYEDYQMLPIHIVWIGNNDNDQNAGSYGEGTNKYKIKGNPLVADKDSAARTSMAQAIWNILNSTYYTPFSADLLGLPYLECGDEINFTDFVGDYGQASLHRYYIMSRTLSGGQHLKDNYSASGNEYLWEFETGQDSSPADTSAIEQEVDDIRQDLEDNYPTNEDMEEAIDEAIDDASSFYSIVSIASTDFPISPTSHVLYCIQGDCKLVEDLDPGDETWDPEDHIGEETNNG